MPHGVVNPKASSSVGNKFEDLSSADLFQPFENSFTSLSCLPGLSLSAGNRRAGEAPPFLHAGNGVSRSVPSADADFIGAFARKTPLNRRRENAEIVRPTLCLLSDGAFCSPGQSLAVDGGWRVG